MLNPKSSVLALLGAALALLIIVMGTAGNAAAELVDLGGPEAVYIVQLADPPVASYRGGIAGLPATNPAARGQLQLDAKAPESVAYAAYLQDRQADVIRAAEVAIGRILEVKFTYQHAYNGFAATMSDAEAEIVAALSGVVAIQPETIQYIQTDVGPQWIGADGVWDGSSTGGAGGTQGEGVIVGIIDTGMNLDHPSFAAVGPFDGYVHINPLGSGNFLGVCLTQPGTFVCNDKLIGYYIYTGETTEDTNGHGSHTGSTAAGNVISGTVALNNYASFSPQIAGVAPHATIIGYDACNDTAGCPGSATLAATNQAVIDGVDVINYSIGGGTTNPWTDPGSLAFLAAQDAGVLTATSAGNSGPNASTVGSPADAPWMLSVGASTHNRVGNNSLENMSGGGTTPPADMSGKGYGDAYGPAPIVYAGDFGDAVCQNPFPANTWTSGEIVVCDRGAVPLVTKSWNILQGGAAGYVLVNVTPNTQFDLLHHLPSTHLNDVDGAALKSWLSSGTGHMATIGATVIDYSTSNGDVMAGFSSRGPLINTAADVIKPDVTAPGVNILAAYYTGVPNTTHPSTEYDFSSGTSMSSPHAAGAAALLRALHPSLTVAEIKSLMMLGATTSNVLKEDGSTPSDPFDRGAGRVDLSQSPTVGLTMDLPANAFQDANPSMGGQPRDLNLPSLSDTNCSQSCSWTRTVTNRSGSTRIWSADLVDLPTGVSGSVTPPFFSLADGVTQTLTITVDVSAATVLQWYFARLELDEAPPPERGGSLPTAYMPVAVFATLPPPVIEVDRALISDTLAVGEVGHHQIVISNTGTMSLDLDWSIHESETPADPRGSDWMDDFDSYATGAQLHGTAGWKGWANSAAAGALTSSTQARSAPNSVDIVGGSDLVQEYPISDGFWTYIAWQYVPGAFSGDHVFILLNQYDDAGTTNNWSTQVHFDSVQGLVIADGVGSGSSTALITDQWVEIRVEIDLVNDIQEFYYDGSLLYSGSWSNGVSGGGITSIGAVDLFANGATSVYYDDMSLIETIPDPCDLVGELPWVVASPTSGTTAPGNSDVVDVRLVSGAAGVGAYTGNLCISSNDPNQPLTIIDLALNVIGNEWYLPIISNP